MLDRIFSVCNYVCPSARYAQGTPHPLGFCNNVEWKLLVGDHIPNYRASQRWVRWVHGATQFEICVAIFG